MSLKITRREVLQFVGGSALGLLLSPIPWKVLDDTAQWTQNWPWMPKPKAGEIGFRNSTCTLCPVSCGMRSRTNGVQPVSSTGTKGHPFNDGALCTTGILAHHLRYHPARLKRPVKCAVRTAATELALSAAIGEIGALIKRSGSVLIIDERPGRTVSDLYRECAASSTAIRYVPCSAPAIGALNTLAGTAAPSFGYDLGAASTILSFGAPVCDGWGSPSRTASYLERRRAGQRLIQIEPIRSRTAEVAGQWIAVRPGATATAALSIASVLLEQSLASGPMLHAITDIEQLALALGAYRPETVADATGIPASTLRETARAFAAQGPSIAIAPQDADGETRAAVMLLNILTGAVSRQGGIALRSDIPSAGSARAANVEPTLLDAVPDHSVNLMILDESLSGSMIPDAVLERKLVANGGIIVSLSPFVTPRPFADQYVIPSSVMSETLSDVAGPFDLPQASLALSSALLPAPDGVIDAIQFAQRMAEASGITLAAAGTSSEELIKKRIAAVHASKRGSVFSAAGAEVKPMKDIASPDDLWSALADGGCWIDEPAIRASKLTFRVMPALNDAGTLRPTDARGLLVYPLAESSTYPATGISPLMSKLSQESGLRLGTHQAVINPTTAAAHEIRHGDAVALRTQRGTMNVQARLDARVMPDVLFVSCSPFSCTDAASQGSIDVRRLCDVNSRGTYTPTPVTIQKVTL